MMKKKIFRIVAVAAVLAGAGVVLFAKQTPNAVDPTPAAAWELRDLDGEVVRSTDFEGKVVVLNFWATWCPPCRVEIPGFTRVQEEYEEQGVVIVGVSLDQTGAAGVQAFSEEMEINYPVVMGDQKIVEAYGGIQALPTTFFIDRNGDIRNVHGGYLSRRALVKTIQPLL